MTDNKKTEMNVYGLKNKKTGILQSYRAISNGDAQECEDISYELRDYKLGDIPWFVTDRKIAENVTRNNTPWFNADYEHPKYKEGIKLEVVDMIIK
jgi:hypothetical protein